MVANRLWKKSLLPSLTVLHGLQEGSRGQREALCYVGDKSVGCFNDRSSENPEEKSCSIVTSSGGIEKELLTTDCSLSSDSLYFARQKLW